MIRTLLIISALLSAALPLGAAECVKADQTEGAQRYWRERVPESITKEKRQVGGLQDYSRETLVLSKIQSIDALPDNEGMRLVFEAFWVRFEYEWYVEETIETKRYSGKAVNTVGAAIATIGSPLTVLIRGPKYAAKNVKQSAQEVVGCETRDIISTKQKFILKNVSHESLGTRPAETWWDNLDFSINYGAGLSFSSHFLKVEERLGEQMLVGDFRVEKIKAENFIGTLPDANEWTLKLDCLRGKCFALPKFRQPYQEQTDDRGSLPRISKDEISAENREECGDKLSGKCERYNAISAEKLMREEWSHLSETLDDDNEVLTIEAELVPFFVALRDKQVLIQQSDREERALSEERERMLIANAKQANVVGQKDSFKGSAQRARVQNYAMVACPEDINVTWHNCIGTIFHPDGEGEYKGEFQNDRRHGRGEMTIPGGRRYVGEFSDDTINGEGTYYFENGTVIVGTFTDGIPLRGTKTEPSGAKYVGKFNADGNADGKGTLYGSNGFLVAGYFENGIPTRGTKTYPDGNQYVGGFRDRKAHGKGILYLYNGKKLKGYGMLAEIEGRFDKGIAKEGTMHFQNGKSLDIVDGKIKKSFWAEMGDAFIEGGMQALETAPQMIIQQSLYNAAMGSPTDKLQQQIDSNSSAISSANARARQSAIQQRRASRKAAGLGW